MRVYVDAKKGSDEIGTGARLNPYATLEKVFIGNKYEDSLEFILGEGEYFLDQRMPACMSANTSIEFYGTGITTTISILGNSINWYGVGYTGLKMTFKKLIFSNAKFTLATKWGDGIWDSSRYVCIIPKAELEFDNVMFNFVLTPKNDGFWGKANKFCHLSNELAPITMKNCTIPKSTPQFIQTNYANKIKVENTYGSLTLGVNYSSYDHIEQVNNQIVTNASVLATEVDFTTYRLLIEEYNARNLGVYRGEYDWDWFNYVIMYNGGYFSTLEENYDTTTKMYKSVLASELKQENGFKVYGASDMSAFFKEITIGEETFRPIDKFDNFKIISNQRSTMALNGIKTTKDMAVATYNINIARYKNVDNITFLNEIVPNVEGENVYVKCVFSFDEGVTWRTFKDGILTELDLEIPKGKYEDLNEDQKLIWNVATDNILSEGCDLEIIKNTKWKEIEGLQRVKFAFAFNTPSYATVNAITQLDVTYDDTDFLKEMDSSEYDCEIYDKSVKVTSKIDNELIKVNILM